MCCDKRIGTSCNCSECIPSSCLVSTRPRMQRTAASWCSRQVPSGKVGCGPLRTGSVPKCTCTAYETRPACAIPRKIWLTNNPRGGIGAENGAICVGYCHMHVILALYGHSTSTKVLHQAQPPGTFLKYYDATVVCMWDLLGAKKRHFDQEEVYSEQLRALCTCLSQCLQLELFFGQLTVPLSKIRAACSMCHASWLIVRR